WRFKQAFPAADIRHEIEKIIVRKNPELDQPLRAFFARRLIKREEGRDQAILQEIETRLILMIGGMERGKMSDHPGLRQHMGPKNRNGSIRDLLHRIGAIGALPALAFQD